MIPNRVAVLTCLLTLIWVPILEAAKPNIVILLCDDLGYGDLACYGHSKIQTPNLDQLAKEGIRFTDCYSSAPVCSPSRAGLFTGRHPYRLGIRDWIPAKSMIHLSNKEITIARQLQGAGYRTALIGKWHLNSRMDGSEPTPGDHGCDYWLATQNNAAPSHQNPINFVRNGKEVGPMKGNSSTILVDEAIEFLKQKSDKPFALFVCFHAPHEPVATPEEWTKKYADVDEEMKRIYYGSVSLIDHEVGRLLKELKDRSFRENTFVFFTSDNGPETLNRYKGSQRSHGSPGPLRGMKLHVTEAGIRVPGIMRWPAKIKPNQVSKEPISNVDLFPTLCQIAGASMLTDRFMDGTNLTPLWEGKKIERKTPLYWQYDKALGDWKIAMRDGDWKLLADAKFEKFALYNLSQDMGESKDRSQETDQADRLKQMKQQMRNLHDEINAGAVRIGDK